MADHFITGDLLSITNNTSLRDVLVKGRNIVNLNPYSGNMTSLKFLWIPSSVMPDNEQNVKGKTYLLFLNVIWL